MHSDQSIKMNYYHGINYDYIIILTTHFIVDTRTELVRTGKPPIVIAIAPNIKIRFKFRLVNLTILYVKSQWRLDIIFCLIYFVFRYIMRKQKHTKISVKAIAIKIEEATITPIWYPIITLIGVPSGGIPSMYID